MVCSLIKNDIFHFKQLRTKKNYLYLLVLMFYNLQFTCFTEGSADSAKTTEEKTEGSVEEFFCQKNFIWNFKHPYGRAHMLSPFI